MFLAPFFTVVEFMLWAFDYRREEIDEWNKIVEADIAFYRKQKGLPMRKGIEMKVE